MGLVIFRLTRGNSKKSMAEIDKSCRAAEQGATSALIKLEIRVLSVGKNSRSNMREKKFEIGLAWQEWIEDLEEETAYSEIRAVASMRQTEALASVIVDKFTNS